ncbi:MAG: type II toxin-antitoxin system RatA family toxin [Steroidobacteraceae bacterium]
MALAAVAAYPFFIPWCSGASIRSASFTQIVADLAIGCGPFEESFTSHVTLTRPSEVLVTAVAGPLEHLTNRWRFNIQGSGTRVGFSIDFQFKSHLLDHVANSMFHAAATRMVGAFESRAHAVYRSKLHPKPSPAEPAEDVAHR